MRTRLAAVVVSIASLLGVITVAEAGAAPALAQARAVQSVVISASAVPQLRGIPVRDIVADVRQDGAGTTLYAWSELPWLFAAGDLENPTPYYTSFLGELVPEAKSQVLEDLALTRGRPAHDQV